jgi:hypothetical protein
MKNLRKFFQKNCGWKWEFFAEKFWEIINENFPRNFPPKNFPLKMEKWDRKCCPEWGSFYFVNFSYFSSPHRCTKAGTDVMIF